MFAGSQSGAGLWALFLELQRPLFGRSMARRFALHTVLVASAGIARPVGAPAACRKESVIGTGTIHAGFGGGVFTGEGSQSSRTDAHHAGAGAAAIQFCRFNFAV